MISTSVKTVRLEIRGKAPAQMVSFQLPEEKIIRIGRAPKSGWKIPWESDLADEHADVYWNGETLTVTCLRIADTPIVFRHLLTWELRCRIDEPFQIGQTQFVVVEASPLPQQDDVAATRNRQARQVEDIETTAESDDEVFEEHGYSPEELQQASFSNEPQQVEILSNLPKLISSSKSDEELAAMLVGLLLNAIPQAVAVAVAHYEVSELPDDLVSSASFPKPWMMRVDARDDFAGRFRPSRRLITKALKSQQSVMQIWSGEGASSGEFTMSEGLNWAFTAPIRGESCYGWCLYVSGQGTRSGSLVVTEDDLKGDLRFTELVAQFIGSIRQVRALQEQKTQMSAFFSPKVIENLMDSPAVLEPAEREITVLFCDVRGFSRKLEQLRDDLLQLLKSVSAALGAMAGGILKADGTIADFQGDAALGFWGWPVELDEGPIPACRAALEIQRLFSQANAERDELLTGFSVGLGIAHGRALAGQIGTAEQAKIGVFGPVVNQGARLEGMTKQFGVPICIDEATAEYVKRLLPPTEGRLRRLAQVYPKGMDTPLTAFGLLPPSDLDPEATEELIQKHDRALDAITEGRWSDAASLLRSFPETDGPSLFLKSFLAEQGPEPPATWDGVIALTSK